MDRVLSENIIGLLLGFSNPINELTDLSDKLTLDEAKELRLHLGKIMIEIDEIMVPILHQYPDLDPDK